MNNKKNITSFIQIDEYCNVPKYKQLINSVLIALGKKLLKKNDRLPSINELWMQFDLSRDTVVHAYNYLKEKKIITSSIGKGYYIQSEDFTIKSKVFLLFNKLSVHKKIIYDHFVKSLGEDSTVDFFIYNNDFRLFKKIITDNQQREYTHYIIIAHFENESHNVAEFLKQNIPLEKLIVLDKKIKELNEKEVSCIYQNFEKNIFEALISLNHALSKYETIKIIFNSKSYHPVEIKKGVEEFCKQFNYSYKIIEDIDQEKISNNTAYINLMEDDLVLLIKKIKKTQYILGKNVGIISYNDTPIKEVLLDGITVISTDFKKLGEQAAHVILNNKTIQFDNPFYVKERNSL